MTYDGSPWTSSIVGEVFADTKDCRHVEEMDDREGRQLWLVEMDPAQGSDRENLAAAMKPREKALNITHRRQEMNAYSMRILQFRRWLVANFSHGRQRLFVEIRRFTIDHFHDLVSECAASTRQRKELVP
jgi:hypothetical protein